MLISNNSDAATLLGRNEGSGIKARIFSGRVKPAHLKNLASLELPQGE